MYNFDEIINRFGTYSSKWDGARDFGDKFGFDLKWDADTIPLFHADMDFRCAPAIVEAMHRVADFGIYGYTMHWWEPKYNDAIVSWYKRRYATDISADEITYADGALEAVKGCVEAFSSPGDGVIITDPVYSSFRGSINRTRRRAVNSGLINDGTGYFTMNWEDFERKCAEPDNKIFLLCSPANPVGRVWSADELRTMLGICRKNGVTVVSDEVHCDILRKGVTHRTILSVADGLKDVVLIGGVSKSFNMAGLHISNVIIPDKELRERFRNVLGTRKPTPFAIAALIAAYNDGEEWLDALNEYLDGAVALAVKIIRENMPKAKVWHPEGTYMLWVDFREYGLTGSEINERIKRANVILQDGTGYDPENGECFQRIAVTAPKSVIETAMRRVTAQFRGL